MTYARTFTSPSIASARIPAVNFSAGGLVAKSRRLGNASGKLLVHELHQGVDAGLITGEQNLMTGVSRRHTRCG